MIKLLKQLKAILALFVPIRMPVSSPDVESIAEALVALYTPCSDDFKLRIKRRVAETVLHTANKQLFTTKLRFYNELQMALSAGAGFMVLEDVKKEEKAREQERQRLQEASSQVGETTN